MLKNNKYLSILVIFIFTYPLNALSSSNINLGSGGSFSSSGPVDTLVFNAINGISSNGVIADSSGASITSNSQNIISIVATNTTHDASIATNTSGVATNAATNTSQDASIATNTSGVATNTATNTSQDAGIATNTSNIKDNSQQISNLKNSSAINAAISGLNYVQGMHSIAVSYGTMQGRSAIAIGGRFKFKNKNLYLSIQGGTDIKANQMGGAVSMSYGF